MIAASDLPGIRLKDGALLSEHTTFQLGGPCRTLIWCRHPDELVSTIRLLRSRGEPFVLMGSGSNLLISDEGYDGVVVRYETEDADCRIEGGALRVSACAVLDHVVKAAIEAGLTGLASCSGIPGTLGGAIVGNAGAFGDAVSDRLVSVRVLEASGEIRDVPRDALEFQYRRSRLQNSGEIVLDAYFELEAGDQDSLRHRRQEILDLRAEKHPDYRVTPCIGSIFRNIEPTSSAERRQAAGYYLDEAGAKELRVGGAYVFEKHANIIIKGDDCTAQDVFDLAGRMADLVWRHARIPLEREVRFLGKFQEGPEEHDRFF